MVVSAQAPSAYPLTAKEIFYAGGKSSPPPPTSPKPPSTIAKAQAPAPLPNPSPAEEKVQVQAQVQVQAPNPPAGKVAPSADPPQLQSVQVSSPAPVRNALKPAFRYSVLKMDAAAKAVEVDPDSVFHNGDQIQLSVEVNCPGFLYIVHRGSSGNWTVLFPSPDIAGGENEVKPGVRYQLPSADDVMTISGQPGDERLVPVFSKVRVKDLEDLIYSIQAEPGRKKPGQPPSANRTMVALNNIRIDDDLLSRLQLTARDLVVERAKAKPSAAAATPAQAVPAAAQSDLAFYAAANSDDHEARVIVSLLLDHR